MTRQRASGNVVAGAIDNSQSSTRGRHIQLPGEIAVFDGMALAGRLVPKGTGYLAFTAAGDFLGLRTSSRIAAGLVYQAHRPGGCA